MTASGLRKMLVEDQILEIIPVSRTPLWRMERSGRFPPATYVSANRKCWYEDEVISWQNSVNERQPNRGRGKGRRAATEKLNPGNSVTKTT